MTCAECGWDAAGAALACERCGAPVEPQDAWPAPRARPGRWIFAGGLAGLVVLATAVVAVIVANSSPERWLSRTQLTAGDCLSGLKPSVLTGVDPSWPAKVLAVPCDQPHKAEVFFAGNIWRRSLPYPGHTAMAVGAQVQCEISFWPYDGESSDHSNYAYFYSLPLRRADWASGDRFVVCFAFLYPGVPGFSTTMSHSIKGSNQ